MASLFPTFPEPAPIQAKHINGVQYGHAPVFDFSIGDFVLDGAGRLVLTDGQTSWLNWCVKTIQDERFAYLVYDHRHGTELQRLKQHNTRAAVQAEFERVATEALLADTRTQAVRGFSYTWRGDSFYATFTVIPTIGQPSQLGVNVSV